MVGWFDVEQLAGTGIRAVLSSVFGAYADKRETIASINEIEIYDEYSTANEVWLDYISDTGDGFNSTFTMAKTIAKDQLQVKTGNSELTLPRAKVVVFGGDQVYPTPARETYQNKFIGPLEAAAPWVKGGKEADMFAVPGNHDWYDGLTSFIKLFCQKRWIGSWQTKQNRTYFALKLTKNTWLWAIDIQLEADIDQPQLCYFDYVALHRMQKGDKIILCSAEPSWVNHTSKREDKTYQNLEFFQKKYIADKGMEQILTLAGDLHHYAHYAQVTASGATHHKITSGGGGAFMHPTHHLPEKLVNMQEGDFNLKKTFPEKSVSRKMAFGDLLFPFYNTSFGFFMASIYLIMAWSLFIASSFDAHTPDIFDQIKTLGVSDISCAYRRLGFTFFHSPTAVIIMLIFAFGFYKFCDVNSSKRKFIGVLGLVHGLLHILLMLLALWAFTYVNHTILGITGTINMSIALSLEAFFIGGFFACMLMGIYLLVSNLVFGIHDNEAFSAMKIAGYKNFLRMHFKDDQLTIYPIGIKKTARWKFVNNDLKTTDTISPELIEAPIIINLK